MCAQAQLRGEVRLYISLRSARTAARWVHGPRWREREWRASDTVVNLSGHSAVRECGAPGVWHWQCGEWGPHYGLGASELKVVRCPTFSPSYYVPHRRVSGASGSGLRSQMSNLALHIRVPRNGTIDGVPPTDLTRPHLPTTVPSDRPKRPKSCQPCASTGASAAHPRRRARACRPPSASRLQIAAAAGVS